MGRKQYVSRGRFPSHWRCSRDMGRRREHVQRRVCQGRSFPVSLALQFISHRAYLKNNTLAVKFLAMSNSARILPVGRSRSLLSTGSTMPNIAEHPHLPKMQLSLQPSIQSRTTLSTNSACPNMTERLVNGLRIRESRICNSNLPCSTPTSELICLLSRPSQACIACNSVLLIGMVFSNLSLIGSERGKRAMLEQIVLLC